MLLAVDIGNTSIKFGIFDGDQLESKFCLPTNDQLLVANILDQIGDRAISRAIICSVVPSLDPVFERLTSGLKVETMTVTNTLDLGLRIMYEPLDGAGTDRVVNSFSAAEKYGVPCIVCSFGTATTIDLVNDKRELVGGLIAPGMHLMSKALSMHTAKLPEVDIVNPTGLINHTTESSIQAGIYYSQIGLIETAVAEIRSDVADATVIATGGFAPMIAAGCDCIDIVDENLLLEGLNRIAQHLNKNG